LSAENNINNLRTKIKVNLLINAVVYLEQF
jgi:hypothetical protein